MASSARDDPVRRGVTLLRATTRTQSLVPASGKGGAWACMTNAVTEAHKGDVRMIDGKSVHVRHYAVTLKG